MSSALFNRLNRRQLKHRPTGFSYAVIKKYAEDNTAYQANLITYYAFMALFPMLIIAVSLMQLLFRHNQSVKLKVVSTISHYFPAMSNELQTNIHSLHRTGLALILSLLIALYGARGLAGAWRYTLDNIWFVPRLRRLGQPRSTFRNLYIILVGGSGLLLASGLATLATSLNHSFLFRLLADGLGILLLFGVIVFLLKAGTTARISTKTALKSALLVTVGLQLLQILGGYVMVHELSRLSLFYGTLSTVLGLLFWIYLQVQVLLWVTEATAVHYLGLWPRSLNRHQLTPQDIRINGLYEKREQRLRIPKSL
ncbi:MAG TPA: YihY/virulence factor BrkB family protein [Candidatus Saccharimonadales bacterium]|jgi:YihY family inner membrane protein|nr:YihY/virulence factor BrkB family protein [Candidatus Saccharimonadales bacterium]